ncbi:MAG: ABC transporter substrate-binding protein [Armatimonadetes bacterium]|nr:ABC transporter substrate-binding protein [Armatimonadota bacterium]
MSERNYTLPILAVLVLCIFGLSEYVTRPVTNPGPIEVVYWEKWTNFEGDAIAAVVDEFNRSQNRVHVKLLTVSGIENKTLLAIAGGNPPDLAGLYGPNVPQYANAKAITPLDDYCAEAGIRPENYIRAYYDIGVIHGHVYSLPTAPASTALHYNRTLLAKAGIDPDKPPQTLEELSEMSDKLVVKDPSGHINVAGFLPAEPGWWNWVWGYMFGGRLWDGKTKITANSEENVRAFEWVQSFSKKYGNRDVQTFRSGFGTFASPQNAFLSEKVAMELQGVWMYNFIDQYTPKLQWSAVPFPHPKDRPDLANWTIVDEDVIVIPRGAKHPNEAFEFIKFLESQKGMELLCLGQRKQSPLAKMSDEFVKKHPNPFIKLFANLPKGNNNFVTPAIGIWPEYLAELNSAFESIILMKATPREALNKVQERIQPKLDSYLKVLKLRNEIADTPTN